MCVQRCCARSGLVRRDGSARAACARGRRRGRDDAAPGARRGRSLALTTARAVYSFPATHDCSRILRESRRQLPATARPTPTASRAHKRKPRHAGGVLLRDVLLSAASGGRRSLGQRGLMPRGETRGAAVGDRLQLVRFDLALQSCPAAWIGHHFRVSGEYSFAREKYPTGEPGRFNGLSWLKSFRNVEMTGQPYVATTRCSRVYFIRSEQRYEAIWHHKKASGRMIRIFQHDRRVWTTSVNSGRTNGTRSRQS